MRGISFFTVLVGLFFLGCKEGQKTENQPKIIKKQKLRSILTKDL